MRKPKPKTPKRRRKKPAAAGQPDPACAAPEPTPAHVREVAALILHGAEPDEILAHAAKESWPYTAAQLVQAQAEAYALMRAGLNETPENIRARHVRQRRLLFAKCMKLQDYKTAHAVLRDEARLLGVYDGPSLPAEDPATLDPAALEVLERVAALTEAELLRLTHETEPAAAAEPGRSGTPGAAPAPG